MQFFKAVLELELPADVVEGIASQAARLGPAGFAEYVQGLARPIADVIRKSWKLKTREVGDV